MRGTNSELELEDSVGFITLQDSYTNFSFLNAHTAIDALGLSPSREVSPVDS